MDQEIEIQIGIGIEDLPIHDVLPQLTKTLAQNNRLILEAPPGAGKSTVVPISLLGQSWLEEKIIIMLEPRRVAARMVATQMAKSLNQEVGQTVGYQIKMDTKKSNQTKILVVTEAILVRMLQSNQSLSHVALIIFDEFHERSIHTDLSLALSLQSQEFLRDDLKLLIMSATLNSQSIQNILGDDVPVISSQGKVFDVENIYLDKSIKQPDRKSIDSILLNTIQEALKNNGDILVFLAGLKEITNIQTLLYKNIDLNNIDILPLYSTLAKKEQDKAIKQSDKTKIILSTNIAQTSLTIPGVKIVIDTGLEKQSYYNHQTNMDHLKLTFISKDSSIQRAGRAGRLENGICYKLWHKDKILEQSTKAEILRTDLTPTLLDLSLWGIDDFNDLKWLDIPNTNIIEHTYEVLESISLIDKEKNITKTGKDSISLGLHPRLSYMILKSNTLGYGYEACILAAILTSTKSLKNKDLKDSFLECYKNNALKKEIEYIYNRLKKIDPSTKKSQNFDIDILGVLLLFAYPNKLAKLRNANDTIYKLSNGKGAILDHNSPLFNQEYLVVASLNAQNTNSYINHAISIDNKYIKQYFLDTITNTQSIIYNKEQQKFDIREDEYFYKLKLSSKPLTNDNKINYSHLILNLIKQEGLDILTWDKKSISLQQRVIFFNIQNDPNIKLPNFSNEYLLNTIDDWLLPYLENIKDIKQLKDINLYPILLGLLDFREQQDLDKYTPLSYQVPSGSKISIDYSQDIPTLNVKVQEIFGLASSPKIFNNTIVVNMNLLSPAMRSIALTNDLKSFWENGYSDVRKDLRGKYKKHYWPENPYEAIATNKTKKKM